MDEPQPLLLHGLALGAAVAVGLATARWGRRGAVGAYVVGLALVLGAWVSAVFLTTRVDGAGPSALAPALGRSLAAIALLTSFWLAIASVGAFAGALARLAVRRRRARRARAPSPPPTVDRTSRRRARR
jgi:hypothetical protein